MILHNRRFAIRYKFIDHEIEYIIEWIGTYLMMSVSKLIIQFTSKIVVLHALNKNIFKKVQRDAHERPFKIVQYSYPLKRKISTLTTFANCVYALVFSFSIITIMKISHPKKNLFYYLFSLWHSFCLPHLILQINRNARK